MLSVIKLLSGTLRLVFFDSIFSHAFLREEDLFSFCSSFHLTGLRVTENEIWVNSHPAYDFFSEIFCSIFVLNCTNIREQKWHYLWEILGRISVLPSLFLQLPENFRNCVITGIELMSNFMLFAFVFNSVLNFPEVLGFV